MSSHQEQIEFPCMGTVIRIQVTDAGGSASRARARLERAEGLLRELDRRLTRFDPTSDLARFNADTDESVTVSKVLLLAVRCAFTAARRSGGLIDPTIIDALERAGYAGSRREAAPGSLREAVRLAPPRRPARPNRQSAWPSLLVDHRHCRVSRPPGVRLDLGGVAKGLSADLVASQLADCSSFAVDCGGDLHVGGRRGSDRAHEVAVEDPFKGEIAGVLELDSGGVATSGIGVHLWRDHRGYQHHLIDPSTGTPAWTGVVAATALGRSTAEAELLSKLAVLSGPRRARDILRSSGGLLVLEDGTIERFESTNAPRS